MRSPRLRLAALAAAPLLLLAGCATDGGDGDAASQSDDAAVTSAVLNGDIEELAVDTGEKSPVITWKDKPFTDGDLPFRVGATESRTVEEGDGAEVAAGDEVRARYLAVNGTTGEQLLSTYDADETVTLDLSNTNLFPAFLEELPGRKAGETLLLAIPASEAFGSGGNEQIGVGADDTLVFYLEVVSSAKPLTEATGEAVKPKAGLPEVEADGTSAAKITIPEGTEEPSKLVVQQLIKGEGEKVKAGQTIKVHYTGVKFSDGEGFDDSYQRGTPAEFPIGVGQVIKGWDEGLVGQPVGSRVLLVIPADQAYGELPEDTGSSTAPPAHELAGETLVFVVDILGAS
ncbi:FKBP-type peptidyl-prolyl cis-trans isomerase [Ornithinimicrobium tianjinense]|uniref:peptidylprolyl isomerase n=1 Tax=Ornithinimicrobium tianjinense TaxID=1195761 RepID=A0A917BLU0_9MICO|nr:FKBP-type peptidyl-prolyl cis-trans isomerase [Ornithinimicrobium tianjinense]GGF47500.1 peptidylprolyl isomerase [Ornithinimicrobium tianjinense]